MRDIVLRSRDRLGVEALELVQFAWWDLSQPGWLRAAEWLTELREEGVVRNIGVTNFDCAALTALLDAGTPVVSNQVQFSLLDRRPRRGLTDLCLRRGVTLLAYGALAGGLLSESAGALAPSRSLVKYRLIADEVGGRPRAGARVGSARGGGRPAPFHHGRRRGRVCASPARRRRGDRRAEPQGPERWARERLRLEPDDEQRLEAAVPSTVPGEVFGLERDPDGPHGRIMRYNLNRDSS